MDGPIYAASYTVGVGHYRFMGFTDPPHCKDIRRQLICALWYEQWPLIIAGLLLLRKTLWGSVFPLVAFLACWYNMLTWTERETWVCTIEWNHWSFGAGKRRTAAGLWPLLPPEGMGSVQVCVQKVLYIVWHHPCILFCMVILPHCQAYLAPLFALCGTESKNGGKTAWFHSSRELARGVDGGGAYI